MTFTAQLDTTVYFVAGLLTHLVLPGPQQSLLPAERELPWTRSWTGRNSKPER
jgi:hypothetical protein